MKKEKEVDKQELKRLNYKNAKMNVEVHGYEMRQRILVGLVAMYFSHCMTGP